MCVCVFVCVCVCVCVCVHPLRGLPAPGRAHLALLAAACKEAGQAHDGLQQGTLACVVQDGAGAVGGQDLHAHSQCMRGASRILAQSTCFRVHVPVWVGVHACVALGFRLVRMHTNIRHAGRHALCGRRLEHAASTLLDAHTPCALKSRARRACKDVHQILRVPHLKAHTQHPIPVHRSQHLCILLMATHAAGSHSHSMNTKNGPPMRPTPCTAPGREAPCSSACKDETTCAITHSHAHAHST